MSCGRIRRLIQAYVDGAASGTEQATVDAHLAGCADCAQVLVDSRRLLGILSAVPSRRIDEGFETRLMASLPQAVPHSRGEAWWERFRFRFEWRLRVPAMMAAGSLTVGICAFLATPQLVRLESTRAEQSRYVAAVVEQHRELERDKSRGDAEIVQASIELNTGDVIQ